MMRAPQLALRRVDLRDAAAVWLRHAEVYLRLWKTELAAPLIEPIIMVFAFGWGLGALVAARVAGLPYLSFVGAGVLAFAVISRAVFETTYGSYFRMVYQSTFDAILATPVEVESLAFAEIAWATTKAAIDSLIILAVLAIFGAATSPLAIFAPLPLLAGSWIMAALSLVVTAHTRDIDSYNLYLAIYFSALLCCGIWYPVEVMPAPLRALAWAIPITSAVDLARALSVGHFDLLRHTLALGYLAAAAIFLTEWALNAMRRRLIV